MKPLSVLIISVMSMALFCQEKKLTLSEVMFYPASGNNEFIEIHNLSGDSIDLTGIKLNTIPHRLIRLLIRVEDLLCSHMVMR